jgi:hypothetical protein
MFSYDRMCSLIIECVFPVYRILTKTSVSSAARALTAGASALGAADRNRSQTILGFRVYRR